MYSSMWSMSIVALLVVDVRTGALHQETQAHRCHQCSPTNSTSCEQQSGWLTATCPTARPYCATVAHSPEFASSLGCAAAADEPCSLTNSPRQTLELTCICTGHLCNAPFSNKLRNDLLNFSSNTNESALTEAFLKLFNFSNISGDAFYKEITVEVEATSARVTLNVTEATTLTSANVDLNRSEMLPRAEPLKQQATVPSDDDEDESEGSGAYEESRSNIQSHTGAAPAAPSSFLPADDNKAAPLFTPSLLFTPIVLTYILL